MSKIGILGGTFNPIHAGHLMLAECARETFGLDEVWFIPTGRSYMKECGGTAGNMPLPEERLRMTDLAIRDNPFFRCLDMEVKRSGDTYSYETLEELRRREPENAFYFILGADCLFRMDAWKEPGRIFAACEIIAATRGDADVEALGEKAARLRRDFGARISLLPFRNLDVSSSEIRERVRQGRSIRYMTPESVMAYIDEKGFYRT